MRLALIVAAFWLLMCIMFVYLGVHSAHAHDIYTPLRDGGSPTGQLCCGGNDCEAVTYTLEPSGDAIIDSRRYHKPILVDKAKITWMAVPGGEAFEAHWCGRPKDGMGEAKLNEPNQPDPSWYTYCAFIAPGGV